jgi:hypothetical protein
MERCRYFWKGLLAMGILVCQTGCFWTNGNCSTPSCNDGDCIAGNCLCDRGFEGYDCSTRSNEKFNGVYTCNETCAPTGVAGPYAVVLGPKATAGHHALFRGLWEVPVNHVSAYIGRDGISFAIPRQPLMTGYEIEAASGTITSDGQSITLNYKIYETLSGAVADECTATLTR